MLAGSGTVRYHNRSPDALDRIVVHLYQNLHGPRARAAEPVAVTGGVRLTRVVVDGTVLQPRAAPRPGEAGYSVDGTIATLFLPQPVRSGADVVLEFGWWFPVPPASTPRMGQDGEVFHLGYWYPQIAVYDDITGWDTEQYTGNAEFYMGYADYDVSLNVPAGWIVSATGELANAAEVLPAEVRRRIQLARMVDTVVHVVRANERGPGTATAAGQRLTWRFTARDVRDFSFNASDRYVWDATRALVGGSAGTPADTALIHALYRPGATHRDQWAVLGRHAIEFPSSVLWPYPYPHMTYVEGLIGGGMEYPMITLIGRPQFPTALSLYSVTVHEAVHIWFPMIVGSHERHYTWMDEGLARFVQLVAMQALYPDVPRDSLRPDTYLPLARRGGEAEMMRHGDSFPTRVSFSVASYDKPAHALRALRAMLGEDTFWQALREYGRRWENRHPQPWDLFNTFEEVSGRQLDWFWRTWFYETWTLDQAIGRVTTSNGELLVTIEDRGEAPMPVRLAVTRTTGRVERLELPVGPWLAGERIQTVRIPDAATVSAVEIDPEREFPDIDRANNRWTR